MKIMITAVTVVALASQCAAAQAQAPVQIAFDGGRVTLSAAEAPVADVLAEWARVGGTKVSGAERLPRRTVTVNLVAADEATALEAIVGTVNGLLASERSTIAAGESRFERIVVVAANGAAPVARPSPAAPVDAAIPESRFVYPVPADAGDPGDPGSLASMIAAGTRQPDPRRRRR